MIDRHLPASDLLFSSNEFRFYYLPFVLQGTLACYLENVSFLRAQKMPLQNVFRDPPSHRAGFVNEWNVCFLSVFEEKFRVCVLHNFILLC